MVKRGDIYFADLSPVVGSEQGGMRPVLIVQNDTGNRHSPTVIAAAITSQTGKARLPTHIRLSSQTTGLNRDSIILLEQIRPSRNNGEHPVHTLNGVFLRLKGMTFEAQRKKEEQSTAFAQRRKRSAARFF